MAGKARTYADSVEERHEEKHLWRRGDLGDHGDIISTPGGSHKVPCVPEVEFPC